MKSTGNNARLVVLLQRGKEFYRFAAFAPTYKNLVSVIDQHVKRHAHKAPESGEFDVSVRDAQGVEQDAWHGYDR